MATPVRAAGSRIHFRNVSVFDGDSSDLVNGDVVIEGSKIVAVSSSPVATQDGPESIIIDGGGRVLMPGLIDAHVHLVGMSNTPLEMATATLGHIAINGLTGARATVLRGFTTVRDMGGDTSSLRTAIDSGRFPGPRIYPSQAAISQTSGHGDFSNVYDVPVALGGHESRTEEIGFMRVADGKERVLASVREQLKRGASQIKMMVGGGAASAYDPLYTVQFTAEEIRAAVEAAEDYGTYVATHVYNVTGIRRAINAGVKSIEHGQLADEATIGLMAEREVWLSTQPFAVDDHHYPEPDRQAKNVAICDGVPNMYEWARKHGVKVAFGTDLLDPESAARQSLMAARLADYCSNLDALRMLTSRNAELLALSGERNPYGGAPLGRIAAGAWADVLLVDGNPLEDLGQLGDPETKIPVIVKDGQLVKRSKY